MDLNKSVNIEDCEAVFRMGPVPRNPKSVRPIMVTLNKSSDKGKIYTKVINLKGLEKWRGTTIADDLSPDQLKDKRDLQAILVSAKFQNVEAKLSELNQLPDGMSLREAKHLNWAQASHSKVKRPHYQTCTGHQLPIKVGII